MQSRLITAFERALFSFRWVLAPIYFGLTLSLLLLLFKFAVTAWKLVLAAMGGASDAVVVGLLGLVDTSLIANLILMVVFSGYENFVSSLDVDDHPDRPSWMGRIGFAEIKLKLMTSLVAITAVHLLEDFMVIGEKSDRELGWAAGLLALFVISAVLLAYMDRLTAKP